MVFNRKEPNFLAETPTKNDSMPAFRTILDPTKFPFDISHEHSILCLGSCFAEHIGQRLINRKFETLINPFGILFNPVSMQISLQMLMQAYSFSERDIFTQQGRWNSFYHHSRFSQLSASALLEHLEREAEVARHFIDKTDRLIITLGTAWVYVHKERGEVVANCHKLPAEQFYRKMLSVPEIISALGPVIRQFQARRESLQVILTVSPVRHIKDGLLENQRSKAALLLAASQLAEDLNYVHYFPAYELMMDDLRDYRFYQADMIHPTEQAIDYIWQAFLTSTISPETQDLFRIIEKVQAAVHHRPFQPASQAHQKFLRAQINQIDQLNETYPQLSFQKERQAFARQLIE